MIVALASVPRCSRTRLSQPLESTVRVTFEVASSAHSHATSSRVGCGARGHAPAHNAYPTPATTIVIDTRPSKRERNDEACLERRHPGSRRPSLPHSGLGCWTTGSNVTALTPTPAQDATRFRPLDGYEQVRKAASSIRGVGPNMLTEMMCTFAPHRYAVCNAMTRSPSECSRSGVRPRVRPPAWARRGMRTSARRSSRSGSAPTPETSPIPMRS